MRGARTQIADEYLSPTAVRFLRGLRVQRLTSLLLFDAPDAEDPVLRRVYSKGAEPDKDDFFRKVDALVKPEPFRLQFLRISPSI